MNEVYLIDEVGHFDQYKYKNVTGVELRCELAQLRLCINLERVILSKYDTSIE